MSNVSNLGIVISAYPCCGKSYYVKNFQHQPYTATDSDSSKYSWIERHYTEEEIAEKLHEWEENKDKLPQYEELKNSLESAIIKERNPNFINDYINHIKEAIKMYNIVFVSSHLAIRQALADNNIQFATVYPKNVPSVKHEWLGRMVERGSDFNFIKDQCDHWEERQSNVENEPVGEKIYFLDNGQYIDPILAGDIMSYLFWKNHLSN